MFFVFYLSFVNRFFCLAMCAENGMDGLEMTKQWLKRSYERLIADANAEETKATEQQPQGGSSEPQATSSTAPASKATPANILNEAYLETLRWEYGNIYPEV
jgi:hypothetical protein